MADLPSITGTIGGVETPLFIGTPSVPGAGASGSWEAPATTASSGGFLPWLGSTPIGNAIGGAVQGAGSDILSGFGVDTGNKTGAGGTSTSLLGGIADFFFRASIMILGLIFIAIGLSMFKPPAVVTETHEHIKRAGKAIRKVVKP